MALNYLEKGKSIDSHSQCYRRFQSDFIHIVERFTPQSIWLNRARSISDTVARVLQTFELSAAWLEDNIKHVEDIRTTLVL